MSDFLPNQTGWVVEWQDEAGRHQANHFILEDQVYALSLEAEKARTYREALKRNQSGEEIVVPKVPGCFPVIGPAPLGLPAKKEKPDDDKPGRRKGKDYMRR